MALFSSFSSQAPLGLSHSPLIWHFTLNRSPDELEIPNCVPRTQIERRDIDQVVEEPDRRVILRFKSKSIREDISIHESLNYR